MSDDTDRLKAEIEELKDTIDFYVQLSTLIERYRVRIESLSKAYKELQEEHRLLKRKLNDSE